MTAEEWRPIPGYEGLYEVSNFGNVASVGFADPAKRKRLTKVDLRGYDRVYLRSPGKKGRWFFVHALVAGAFIGPRPEGAHVNHEDGCKKNNTDGNLKYCTPSQNQKHSFRLGLQSLKGEKHTQAKLNDEAIQDIRARAGAGESQTSIARSLDVTPSAINHIVRGKRWAHIPFAGKVRVIPSHG